jgi:hypothetical protein
MSTAEEPLASPRTRSRARRLAIALALVAGSLVLAEVASRGLMHVVGRPYDEEEARTLLASWVNALGARVPLPGTIAPDAGGHDDVELAESGFTLQPYVAWQTAGFERVVAADAAYYGTAEAESTYDVCLLGGSVADIFGRLGAARLAERLRADARFAGRKVRISNYASPGYKEPQQLLLFAFLLNVGHAPDAVIEIDGFNEVALGNDNVASGVHPHYPSITHWGAAARDVRADGELVDLLHEVRERQRDAIRSGRRALASGSWRSCLLGHAAIARVGVLRGRYLSAHDAVLAHLAAREDDPVMRGPTVDTAGAERFRLVVAAWEESSRMIGAIARDRGIAYLHVLQPTLHDAGSKRISERERAISGLAPAWREGAETGYPMLRVAGERLRARGIAFHDASMLFRDVTEELYYDGCHFGERGNVLLADEVAVAFLDSIGAQR